MIYLQSSWYDLALLKFEGGLPEGFAAATVLSDFNKIQKGTKILAAGFGVADAESKNGIGRLRSTELQIDNPFFHDNEVSVDQKESGTCEGDSGGPIFLQDGENYFLVGLTSHGINDNLCRGTAVFTSLIPFGDWLKANAK